MKIKKEDKNKERNVLKGSVIAIIIFDNIIVFVTYKISKKS